VTGCTTPPREFISAVSGGDFDDFDEIGQHLFDLIRGRCNVKPSDHILDIGSGCGRVAIPFTSYLSGGKYDGFDVVLPMVEWCREYITSRYPNFLFNHADLSNTL
jgi:ubiquinone/menaquinone biosynthesis C-methylase UbiE